MANEATGERRERVEVGVARPAAGPSRPPDSPSFIPEGADARLIDYLSRRRSVPAASLKAPGPEPDTLAAMLTIAARVPDHGKLAPFRFVVFAGEARAKAGEAFARILEERDGLSAPDLLQRERDRFCRAPVVVAVVSRAAPHPKIPEWEQVLAAGAAALNLVHAANAHGFSANWLTEWIAYDADARAALGIGPEERVAAFIHIGRAGMVPTDRARPALAELVTYHGAA